MFRTLTIASARQYALGTVALARSVLRPLAEAAGRLARSICWLFVLAVTAAACGAVAAGGIALIVLPFLGRAGLPLVAIGGFMAAVFCLTDLLLGCAAPGVSAFLTGVRARLFGTPPRAD